MSGDAWGGSWGNAWGGSWGAVDVSAPTAPAFNFDDDFASMLESQRDRIRQQNDLIMQTVIAAVVGGLIE